MATSGVFLYRNHDDILFFGHDDKPVLQAWETIHTLTTRFNLRLNHDKSGSVRLCCASRESTETEAETSSYGLEPLPQKPMDRAHFGGPSRLVCVGVRAKAQYDCVCLAVDHCVQQVNALLFAQLWQRLARVWSRACREYDPADQTHSRHSVPRNNGPCA